MSSVIEIQTKLNLGQEDSAALQRAMSMVQQQYPTLKPEIAMSILSSYYPTTGEIFSGTPFTPGRDKFDVPIGTTDYLVKFDPTDKNNPLALRLAQAAGKGENLLSGGSDTTKIPTQQKQGDDVDITSLTPQALDYREQQILQSLPTVESVTKETPEVQARFDQLYRASYGNMPRSEVPASELKTLEERALQDARNTIQQMRTKATSQFKDERSRRQRMEPFSSMGDGGYSW